MAHLDIQEKKGGGWLWWLLGLVALALLAWWLLTRDNDADVDTVGLGTTPAVVATDPMATPDAGVITDFNVLMRETDANALMGRRVALTNVPVSNAVSDKGFWIGQGTGVGQGIFAVRTNQMQSNTAADGAVTAGKNVNVWGVVTAMPTNLSSQTATWNLQATDTQALAAHRHYIHVDSVRITN
ncbi:MAG: hypothetical protein H0X64_06820 [Gemmatimonadaceae bacterium]|nr:hypothetical protein [Gemmatimonadaceae bacterium]